MASLPSRAAPPTPLPSELRRAVMWMPRSLSLPLPSPTRPGAALSPL